jgi:aldehyde dehydrogenase (NAD+)
VSPEPTTELWHEERLLIDGALRSAEHDATYPVENPATGGQLGVAADATPADVEAALAAARRAFDESGWAGDVELRVRCLRQLHQALVEHADQLTELTIAEVGAPRSACATVQLTAPTEFLAYYADLAENYEWATPLGVADTLGGPAERWTERNPIGVVAAITPWNVPHQINLAKIAPALAAGCTVVLKPAPETPWCGLALGRLVAEHTDIPAGVFNVVTSSDPAIGELLTGDPRVDMVSFTGSTATGRRVMAAASANVTKVFLELGGKSASIVLDDVVDFGLAAATAAFGTATVAGQGCALTTRVLLPRSRYEEGVDAIAEMMAAMTPGDPTDPGTMMGPLISDRQWQRVNDYVRSAEADGARVVCGGGRPSAIPDGHFFDMTLLADVTADMAVASEEVFGPVLVAIAYEDDDDAVRIANDSIYGLSGAVFGADEYRALAIARRIRTGTMSINGGVWYGVDVPFGGVKQSGIGREMGVAGFEEYLDTTAFARPVG